MFPWDNDAESHPETYGQLRKSYEGDPKAQRQIDVYDPSTEYQARLAQLTEALQNGDEQVVTELHTWFNTNYPDIG